MADREPVDSRYIAYRGAIGMSEMSAHAGLDNVVLWTGHEFHLVQRLFDRDSVCDVMHADSVGIMLRDVLLKNRAAAGVSYVDWMYGRDIFDRA